MSADGGRVADGDSCCAAGPSTRRAGARAPRRSSSPAACCERVTWLAGADADGIGPDGTLILPGLVDLHAHFREPGNEDAETIATGLAAAAHGGFTTVCLMPNTTPAIDEPSVVARVRAAAAASGSPVRVLVHGAVTAGRTGETLAALGELADAGVVGFSRRRVAGALRRDPAQRARVRRGARAADRRPPRGPGRSPRAPRRPRATWPRCSA